MNIIRKNSLPGLLVLLTFCGTVAQPGQLAFHRAKTDISTTRPVLKEEAGRIIFQKNPLLLNGRTLDVQTFSMDSRGRLSVIGQEADQMTIVKVPFRIYLRRNGEVVNLGASDPDRVVTTFAVEELMRIARPGDDLVIEPARPADAQATRSIRLVKYFDWLRFAIGKRTNEGC